MKQFKKGFTLIEILVVIGIIAILAAVVIIAINPARQFAQARNSQRQANVTSILNGLGQNLADNKGTLACSSLVTPISSSTALHIGTASGLIDLSCLAPTYLPSGIPTDPTNGTPADTGYTIMASSSRYVICAPNAAEPAIAGSAAICVIR